MKRSAAVLIFTSVFALCAALLFSFPAAADETEVYALAAGKGFNTRLKQLSNHGSYSYEYEDHNIEHIVFCPCSTLPDYAADDPDLPRKDVGEKSGTVTAVFDEDIHTMYIASDKRIRLNPYLGYSFSRLAALRSIDFTPLETVEATYLHGVFFKDEALEEIIGLDRIDTSRVGYMDNMFDSCASLKKLDLSCWDTSSCTNFSEIFQFCSSLEEVDVSGWQTENNKDFDCIFKECRSLESVDVSQWDTSGAVTMCHTFSGCTSLTGADISGWDVSGVTKFECMFKNCTSLKTAALPHVGGSAVSIRGMFCGCENISGLEPGAWDVSNVSKFDCLFQGCSSLRSLDLSGWNTACAANTRMMLADTGIEEITAGEGFTIDTESAGLTHTADKVWYNSDKNEYCDEISGAGTYRLVYRPVKITMQPEAQCVPLGKRLDARVEAEGTGVEYRWQYRQTSGSKWHDFGADSDLPQLARAVRASWNGWEIRCRVTDTDGNEDLSDIVGLTVILPPTITVQPQEQYVKPGKRLNAAVEAEGAELSYQWQYKQTDSSKWQNFGADSTSPLLCRSVRDQWDGWTIRCRVTNGADLKTYSDEVKIHILRGALISVQPTDQRVAVGERLGAFVEAEGAELKYQWQFKQNENKDWQNFGADSTDAALLRRTLAKWDGWLVRCKITDAYGIVVYTDEISIDLIS